MALDGRDIRIGSLAVTGRLCRQALMGQERKFLDALERARRFESEAQELRLYDQAGETLVRFVPL